MLATLPLTRLQSDRDYYGLIIANPRTSEARRLWARGQQRAVVAEIEKRERETSNPGG